MKDCDSIHSSASCIQAAADILGDKWTPLLIGALSAETMRFCQLQTAVGNVNPRTLSQRLQYLELQGVIRKTTYAQVPPHTDYALTDKGRDLVPILRQMSKWSSKYGPQTVVR